MSLLDRLFKRNITQEAFAQKMLDALSRAGLKDMQYNAEDFCIVLEGGKNKIYLNNIYTDYNRLSGKARDEHFSRFILGSVDRPSIPEDFAAARTQLMPIVRDPAYHQLFRLRLIKEGGDGSKLKFLSRPLVEGLEMALAYDMKHGIASVGSESLEKWGVGLEEALVAAKDNLRDQTLDSGMAEIKQGVYLSKWGDSYESSRLLLTDFIYRLQVYGEPVAFVPNRDTLWITGSRDTEGLTAILAQGREQHFNSGHPLSPNLYILLNGEWRLYIPEDAALRGTCLDLKRDRDAIDYHQQKECLDAIHEREKKDLFVAKYQIYEHKMEGQTTKRISTCAWSPADALLPRAENITFVLETSSQKKDIFTVPWEAAVQIAGDHMQEEPDMYPRRYRTRTLPSEAQIAELRKVPDSFAQFRRP